MFNPDTATSRVARRRRLFDAERSAADPVTIATDIKTWADAKNSEHFRNRP